MKKWKTTDYKNLNNWMLCPQKVDFPVDIFYVYPTAYFPKSLDDPMVCSINNESMRRRAMANVRNKGSAFITIGNYFVPYYQQACIQCLNSKNSDDTAQFISGPFMDIVQAFTLYMNRYNQGRPFILAGHSQGSVILSLLLSTIFATCPEYMKKLVVAYVIGYGITEKYLNQNPHLKFAEGELDTGVIVSYNTEAPGMMVDNIVVGNGTIAINPITWTRSEEYASSDKSLGSHIVRMNPRNHSTEIIDLSHYADAKIDARRGVVICSTADPDDFRIEGGETFFPRGILHNGDYSLYYNDLRENAAKRVKAYFEKLIFCKNRR